MLKVKEPATNTKNKASKSDEAKAKIGLKAVLNILDKWQCTPQQAQDILQVSKATYYKLKKDPSGVKLSHDQFERLSYILNIHSALRILFNNPDNCYGFMRMPNHNPYFNGQTPLSLIATGNFGTLYEVHQRIDALRGGSW